MSSIIQFAGEKVCSGVNNLDTLIEGHDIPEGATWAPFTQYQDDRDLSHYKIQDGKLFYLPENGDPIPAPYGPDPIGLKKALNDSADLSDLVKVQLGPQLYLLDTYLHDPEGTKQQWTRVKAVLNLNADPLVVGAIEAAAAAFGMPLT